MDDEILDDDLFQPKELTDEEKIARYELKLLQRKINRAGNFLFAIGIITFINAFYYQVTLFTSNLIISSIIGAFYIGMGFLSTIKPKLGFSLAITVYLGFFLVTTIMNPHLSAGRVIIKLIVASILVSGLFNANKAEKYKKAYRF